MMQPPDTTAETTYDALAFDWDGTLVRSMGVKVRLGIRAAKRYGLHHSVWNPSLWTDMQDAHHMPIDLYAKLLWDRNYLPKRKKRVYEEKAKIWGNGDGARRAFVDEFVEYYHVQMLGPELQGGGLADRIDLIGGNILTYMAGHGLPAAIVTNEDPLVVNYLLQHYEIDRENIAIHSSSCNHSAQPGQGKKEALYAAAKAVKERSIDLSHVAFVDDKRKSLDALKELAENEKDFAPEQQIGIGRMHAVLVKPGRFSNTRYAPNLIVRHVDELIPFLATS